MRKLSKKLVVLVTMLTMIFGSAISVFASDAQDVSVDTANNYYFAGNDMKMDGGVYFGSFGAGQNLEMDSCTIDDVTCLAGMNITVRNTSVGSSLFAAGSTITFENNAIEGNIFAAGQSVNADSSVEAKSFTAVGQSVGFDGTAEAANIAAEEVIFNGRVTGDVTIEADTVTIGDDAVVTGTLKVISDQEPEIGSGSQINDVDFIKTISSEDGESQIVEKSIGFTILEKVKSAIYWSIAMILVGLIMCWLMKDSLDKSAEMLKSRTAIMLGTGAITLIAVPLAAIICMITFIGLPIGLVVAALYTITMCFSVAFTGASLGRLLFNKMPGLAGASLGILILEFAKKIPFLGGLIFLFSVIYTMGYAIQALYLNRIKKQN